MWISEFTGVKAANKMLSLVTLPRTATSLLQLAAFRFLLFCLRITSILYLLLNALQSFLFIPIICSVDLACLNWILYSCQCNGCNVYWHYINTVTACDCPLFQILPSLSFTGVMLVAVILCNNNDFWSCVCFFFFTSLWKFYCCWTRRCTMLYPCGIPTVKLMKS